MKTLVFGEIVWDEYVDNNPKTAYIGGAALNFAAHAAKLGADAALCSAVGEDGYGNKSFESLKALGINTDFVYRNRYRTGRCEVTLDADKMPKYLLDKISAYDHIEIGGADISKIQSLNADLFYFGTLAQRSYVSRRSLAEILKNVHFSEIFCDINLRDGGYTKETIAFCLETATLLKISREEETLLTEFGFLPVIAEKNHAERCKKLGSYLAEKHPQLNCFIYTLDKDGAAVYDAKTKTAFYSLSEKVTVVSTVGAGDSFSAAFAASYVDGLPIDLCLKRAIKLSSFVVSTADAIPDYTLSTFE